HPREIDPQRCGPVLVLLPEREPLQLPGGGVLGVQLAEDDVELLALRDLDPEHIDVQRVRVGQVVGVERESGEAEGRLARLSGLARGRGRLRRLLTARGPHPRPGPRPRSAPPPPRPPGFWFGSGSGGPLGPVRARFPPPAARRPPRPRLRPGWWRRRGRGSHSPTRPSGPRPARRPT